jgi:aspartyl protease family protein
MNLDRRRFCTRALHVSAALCLFPWKVDAAQVQVIGLTEGKATLVIDSAKPRTLAVGQASPEGVRLLSATPESAVVEIEGKRTTLRLGSHYRMVPEATPRASVGNSVVIPADSRGHFLVMGTVNRSASVRFLVDTGATMVSLNSEDARRAGINYLAGQRALTQTASGVAPVYRVKLDSVQVGDITLYNVDAAVHDSGALPIGLLGMSFLNRMEMKRDGAALTLIRRY